MDIGNDNLIEFYYIYLITKLDKNKYFKKMIQFYVLFVFF